jgi:putative tryptophan/tyrosine transport system substrate-binding protein
MRRRDFIATVGLVGTAASGICPVHAQQSAPVRRVAILFGLAESDREAQSWFDLFRQTMQGFGWIEGRNLIIHYRWTAGDPERAKYFADELVNAKPDALFATNTVTLSALQQRTATIPVVFVQVSDPVGNGFVKSLARPEGNITGFAHFDYEIGGKWLEILKDAVPGIQRVGILYGRENPASEKYLRTIEMMAASLKLEAMPRGVRDAMELGHAIGEVGTTNRSGMIVQPSPLTIRQRKEIVSLAAKYRLPAIYPFRFFAVDGGLLSYGVHTAEQYRQTAGYIDRILRGQKPRDLPVQAPTRFELVLNLKTAREIGITIPPTTLARVDEVIE